jgi:hypothetical protein
VNVLATTCARCDSAMSLPTGAVLLTRTDDGAIGWLICDHCQDLVGRSVPGTAYQSLLTGGCHLLRAPEPLPYPEQRPSGPALHVDDVLTLHELLADDEALAAVLRGLGSLAEPGA